MESPILDKIKDLLNGLMKKKAPPVAESPDDEPLDEEGEEAPRPAPPAATAGGGWQAKVRAQLPFLARFLPPVAANEPTDVGRKAPASAPTGDDAKKAQRQKLIRVVLVLGLLYLAYDTLMPSEEPVAVEAPAQEAPAHLKKKKRRRPKDDAATAGAEAAPADTTVVASPAETPADSTAAVPATETVTPMEAAPAPTVEPGALSGLEAPAVEATTAAPGGEANAADQVADTPTVPGEDMTEKILEDLEKKVKDELAAQTPAASEYVGPPNYDNTGRGLVYNCLGKHWACVDGGSYRVCQQNFSALKTANRPKECWPDSVYESSAACVWVQKQKVSGSAKTEFCQ